MHGTRGSGLALARSARQTGQIGGQPNSKNDAVTRGTAVVLYHKSTNRCGKNFGKNRAAVPWGRNRRAVPAWEPEVRIRPW